MTRPTTPLYGPGMSDPDGHFGEKLAARYDDSSAGMFAAGAVDPAAGLLAGLVNGCGA